MDLAKKINSYLTRLEEINFVKKTPGILHDYEKDYPQFKELEDNYETVRKECEALLAIKEQIHDVQGMAGNDTQGGIHGIQWKSFMFKAGRFIEENCEMCPETARIIKKIPRIKQAFFSILYPNQYIVPHKGYYNGFMRYHMGIIIPDNNEHNKCWLRVHTDPYDNKIYDKASIHKGEAYHWKNGKGIIFNDNYLHDASNETDEIRVVLWIDVVRKYPIWLDWLNRLMLNIAYQTRFAKKIAEEAKIKKGAKAA